MSKHHENLLVRQTLDKVGKNWGLATPPCVRIVVASLPKFCVNLGA